MSNVKKLVSSCIRNVSENLKKKHHVNSSYRSSEYFFEFWSNKKTHILGTFRECSVKPNIFSEWEKNNDSF